ncbi:MAG: PAS domain S-box protein [Candidatus Methanofastidiosa archaeon]|nr:PAS domain S-box protein [Candidatus Methanofastidiosa archaeon]
MIIMSDFYITEKPDLPEEILEKWQRIVNLIAKIIRVPACLIMKVDPPEIEVFLSSKTEGNPYHKGERASLNTGLYCETVMQKRESLLVPDATKDSEWDHNPDIALGMVYYLGFPIQWPDGQIFGTICVLDYKNNPNATTYKDLINEFKTTIETDLDNFLKKYELEHEKEKLRKSEEKYRLLAEAAKDLIFVHDITGKILYANKSALEKTAYSLEDLPNLKIMDLVPTEYKKILDSNIKERLKGDMSSKLYEIECLTKSGKKIPLEVISTPFFIDEVLTFQVIARDITERKKAEITIKESNILYSTIAENLPNGIVHVFDKDFRHLYSAGEELGKVGLTNEMLVGKSIYDILPLDAARYVDQMYRKVLKGDKVNFEGVFNNITFWVNAIPLKNSNGDIDKILVLSVNVTDRKKIEAELKESEEKYRELVENANSIIAKFDKDGTILSMNEYGLSFFGYTKQELIGKKWQETCIPCVESTGRILENLITDIYFDVEKYATHINENIKKNGERVWIHWTNKPIKDEKGNIKALLCVGTDITSRKKMEEELKESEERFRLFFEKANDPIFLVSDDDSILDVNEAACKKFGYSKEEFLLLKIPDIQAPEVRGAPGTVIKSELEKYADKPFEAIGIDKSGKRFYVEVVATRLKLKGKDVVLNISRDISERKKLEEEIKLLYKAIEQAPSIITITDKNATINYVNPKFTEVTGYSSSEAIGKSPRILKSGFLPEEQYEILWKTISSGGLWKGEFQNRKKDGTYYWESASISPVKNSVGEITHFLKVSEDITFKKLAEKELQEKEETLRGILSAAPVGINLVQNRIMKWSNHAMAEITGYSENELIGSDTRFLYTNEEEYEKFGKVVQERKNKVTKYEAQWITKDKRLIDVLILARPINPYDFSKGVITIVSDITKAKKAQKQLDENLEYFAHLVDHIRNPLAIISGFAQVEVENEKTKERIMRQIDRIEDLINQLDQGWMDTEETRRFLRRYL